MAVFCSDKVRMCAADERGSRRQPRADRWGSEAPSDCRHPGNNAHLLRTTITSILNGALTKSLLISMSELFNYRPDCYD